jgi:hypothetical protein
VLVDRARSGNPNAISALEKLGYKVRTDMVAD